MVAKRAEIIAGLQKDILRFEGYKPCHALSNVVGLGSIINAFPDRSFPTGAIHEFIAEHTEDGAAACGFIAGILSHLMGSSGAAIWISTARTLFPPALKTFGIQPDKIIFLDVKKPKDVLWAMEEALKCEVLTAVIGEVSELGFIESRRLQLAVERSKVTGFVLRDARKLNTTACMSRWMIAPCASVPIAGEAKDGRVDELPGLGFPQWKVKLLRIKNGRPGEWDIAWAEGKFMEVKKTIPEVYHQKKRAV